MSVLDFSDRCIDATNTRQTILMTGRCILWRGLSTLARCRDHRVWRKSKLSESFVNNTTGRFVVPRFTEIDTSGCIGGDISILLHPEIRSVRTPQFNSQSRMLAVSGYTRQCFDLPHVDRVWLVQSMNTWVYGLEENSLPWA
jgi:hypothetical protein